MELRSSAAVLIALFFFEVCVKVNSSSLDFKNENDKKIKRSCGVGNFTLHCSPCDVIRIVNMSYAGRHQRSAMAIGDGCRDKGFEQQLNCSQPFEDHVLKSIVARCNTSQSCELNYRSSNITCDSHSISATCCLEIVYHCERRDSRYQIFQSFDGAGNTDVSLKCDAGSDHLTIEEVILGFSREPEQGCYWQSKNTAHIKNRCGNNRCENATLAGESNCGVSGKFNDEVYIYYGCSPSAEKNKGDHCKDYNRGGKSRFTTEAALSEQPNNKPDIHENDQWTYIRKVTVIVTVVAMVVVFLIFVTSFYFCASRKKGHQQDVVQSASGRHEAGNDVTHDRAVEEVQDIHCEAMLDSSTIESQWELEGDYDEWEDQYAEASENGMVEDESSYAKICPKNVNRKESPPVEQLQKKRGGLDGPGNVVEDPCRATTGQVNATPHYAVVDRRTREFSQTPYCNIEKQDQEAVSSVKTASTLYSNVSPYARKPTLYSNASSCALEIDEQAETALY